MLNFIKNIFYKKNIDPYDKLKSQSNLYLSKNLISEYQKTESQIIYHRACFDYYLSEEIKVTPNSVGEYKYQYKKISPTIINFIPIDSDIMEKAQKNVKSILRKKDLVIPGILDLDNPIHYVFSYFVVDRFESVVREYGLNNDSLEKKGITHAEDHIKENLLDDQGVIYNSLIYLRDYQDSHRYDSYLGLQGDYFEELIEKFHKFK